MDETHLLLSYIFSIINSESFDEGDVIVVKKEERVGDKRAVRVRWMMEEGELLAEKWFLVDSWLKIVRILLNSFGNIEAEYQRNIFFLSKKKKK